MSIVEFNKESTVLGANLKPKRYDIEIYQGDTFSFDLVLKDAAEVPVDITGWTVIAQIKKISDSSPGEAPSFEATVSGTSGKITLKLSDTETAALDGATEYKYDVQTTDTGGNKRTYIGGVITVDEDVTE